MCVYVHIYIRIKIFSLTYQNSDRLGVLGALFIYLPELESAKVTRTQYPPLRKKLMLCAFKACLIAAIL